MLSRKIFASALALSLVAASCGGSSPTEDVLLPLETGTATATPVQFASGDDGADATPDGSEDAATAPTALPTLPPAAPIATATPIAQRIDSTKYTVQSGDVLGTIAERFGVTQRAILDANDDLANANQLSVGQELTIPPQAGSGSGSSGSGSSGSDSGSETATPKPTATTNATPRPTVAPIVVGPRTPGAVDTYVVRDGQYLSNIAAAYGVSVQSIVDLNGLASSETIFIGQQLQIPPQGTTTIDTSATPTPVPAATADPNATPTMTPVPATPDPAAVTPTPTVDAGVLAPTLTPTPGGAGTATPIPDCTANNPFGFDCAGIPDP